jgi:hypothetical protein
VLPIKRKYFSLPLFGVYLIFLSFSIILERLKKNKRMLRYKGGSSVTNILVPSAKHRDAQGKGTYAGKGHSGKILQGPKVSRRRGKVL